MKSRRKQTFASRNRRLLSVFYRTPVFTEHRLSRPRISVNPMLPHMLSIQDREATGPITGMAFRSSVPAWVLAANALRGIFLRQSTIKHGGDKTEGTAQPQESPQKDYNAWMREEMEKEPDTGPLIVGMTCIYVPVSNVFESVEWYRENLGCEPTHHNPVRPGMAKAIMRFPDYERTKAPAILLVQARDCAGMLEFADDDGNSSAVACLVAPRLQEVHDRLKKNGVVVEGGPGDERVSASSVKFHDPDGNQWEVWQP